jgi:hypothetical protein
MDLFAEITLGQIVLFTIAGLGIGVGIRAWRDQQVRQAKDQPQGTAFRPKPKPKESAVMRTDEYPIAALSMIFLAISVAGFAIAFMLAGN